MNAAERLDDGAVDKEKLIMTLMVNKYYNFRHVK